MIDQKAWNWVNKNKIGYDIWNNKYRYNNETFDEWLDRVSGKDPELRQLIESRKFLFGGRALTNRGTGRKGSMFNCYSSGYAPDDIEGLMQLNTNLALTYKAQGGQGVSLTNIRPKGTPIGNEFESDGIVPFMEIFNATTASISQGGARKGALMMSLDITHKEADTFIKIKTNEDKITKANLSLEIDDAFMYAVKKYYETGETITFYENRVYNGHVVEYEIIPIELYKMMIETVHEWGEPGCIFTGRFRNYNLMEFDDDYQIETCNPCGEQPLPKNFSCNLGSINLSEFVIDPYTMSARFDFVEFERAVKIAVRALDTIIDENLNHHALKEQADNSRNYRNIGLGVMGYANMLFKLGLTYGSAKAINFTKNLFSDLLIDAIDASRCLAEEKGAFPKCKPDRITESAIIQNLKKDGVYNDYDLENISNTGLRNCSLISIAPTGSIATMLGVSGGCEPEFALSYTRRTENLDNIYQIYSDSVEEYWNSKNIINEKRNLDSLPEYFVTAKDINWLDRIKTQAAMQNYVDTAISSTINLPQETTTMEIEHIYLEAWKHGLKGITIYRAGCKREGILVENKKVEEIETSAEKESGVKAAATMPRGYVVDVNDDLIGVKRKLTTGCGTLHFEVYVDEFTGEPQETFINIGSSGGCERNYQFISRLMSLALRAGVPIEAIIDQAKSIKVCSAYRDRMKLKGDTSKGTSCPSAIGYALEELYKKAQDRCHDEDDIECTQDDIHVLCTTNCETCENKCGESEEKNNIAKCPECGADIVFEGGCNVCKLCGWSKCD